MFTGLVQAVGKLRLAASNRLEIYPHEPSILQALAIGDSVAVDGVCLTVAEILPQGFAAITSPETLERTSLSQQANTAALVNLEASLRVGDKLGGHFVTGHVDGVGYVQTLTQTAESWEISFTAPGAIAYYIVPKGSIAVNGISLTVADCHPEGSWFKVAVVPHSFEITNLRYLQPGSLVNLEGDLLGKYAAKLLRLNLPQAADLGWDTPSPAVTPEFLAEHGFT